MSFEDVQVGQYIMHNDNYGSGYAVGRVVKVTKTTFTVMFRRRLDIGGEYQRTYQKTTGRERGWSDSFRSPFASEVEQKTLESLRRQAMIRKARKLLMEDITDNEALELARFLAKLRKEKAE